MYIKEEYPLFFCVSRHCSVPWLSITKCCISRSKTLWHPLHYLLGASIEGCQRPFWSKLFFSHQEKWRRALLTYTDQQHMLHVVQSTFPQFELFARILIDWPAIICVQAMLSQLANRSGSLGSNTALLSYCLPFIHFHLRGQFFRPSFFSTRGWPLLTYIKTVLPN